MAQTKDDAAHRTEHDANFFDPNNAEHTATREHLAMDTLEELLHWLMEENGSVGILGIISYTVTAAHLDATNSTVARRQMILRRVHEIEDLNILFLESICTDKKVIESGAYLVLIS